jgi:elongation factor P
VLVSISTNALKNGMALNLPSEGLVTVIEFQHVKPGKGGAFVRTKLKKVSGGSVLERTFRADEKVPLAVIDKREMAARSCSWTPRATTSSTSRRTGSAAPSTT